jgi:hypothetical protein
LRPTARIGLLPEEYDSARDDNGHGTHTASTRGQPGVTPTVLGIQRNRISGIARAYVVAYRAALCKVAYIGYVCGHRPGGRRWGGAINYSIGGGASLTGADDIAFLFAADVGSSSPLRPATPARRRPWVVRLLCPGSPRLAPARSGVSSRARWCWETAKNLPALPSPLAREVSVASRRSRSGQRSV